MRVDSSSLIAGALVCGDRGLGVLGSAIPSVGGNGAGYAYNDLSLPADNGKEICGRITTWPAAGTLVAYEDTSFTFSGAPDGSYSFGYQLYVDGAAVGSPVSVSLQVGAASAAFSITTEDATFTGSASIAGAATTATVTASTDDSVFSGNAYVSGVPNAVIFATTDNAVFQGGAASSSTSIIDSNLSPADPLYLFYVGWPAVSVVYKPKSSSQQFQARAILDQPGTTLINNELLAIDCALHYPAVSFPRVRKGDTFIVAGITYAARENAQPLLDGLEDLCPLAKV